MMARLAMPPGMVFGDYTVLPGDPTRDCKHRLSYPCLCICGVTKFVNASNLRSGKTKGCGCRANKETSERSRTHGMSGTPIYAVWRTMKQRTRLESDANYPNYGGRGIGMCDEWYDSFEKFCEDMGPQPFPKASIDRRDNNQGYSKANCRWATRTTQNRNKSNNRYFEYNGKRLLLPDWAKELGIGLKTLVSRVYLYKWPVEKAFSTPIRLNQYA